MKKRTILQICRIRLYKFYKRNQNNVDSFLFFIFFAVICLAFTFCKPFKIQVINIIELVSNILLYVVPIIAFFVLLFIGWYLYDIESNYNLQLENKEGKTNFKRGFNRLNVVFVTICTILFSCIIGGLQYGEYKNFEKDNAKFLNLQTKNEIVDVCNAFPEKEVFIENNLYSSRNYYIESITPEVVICKDYEDNTIILKHKQDLYIKMPHKWEKLVKMVKCFAILFFALILFYTVLRLLYILLIKIIGWVLKGFRE